MAEQRNDPYQAYNFRVEIDGVAEAGFSEVSGLTVAVDVIEYRTGDDPPNSSRKVLGRTHYPNITLKRGLIGSLAFYQWLRDGSNGSNVRRNVTISLFNEDRSAVVMAFRLRHARIVKMTAGPLNARANDVAMEELVLAHEQLEIE